MGLGQNGPGTESARRADQRVLENIKEHLDRLPGGASAHPKLAVAYKRIAAVLDDRTSTIPLELDRKTALLQETIDDLAPVLIATNGGDREFNRLAAQYAERLRDVVTTEMPRGDAEAHLEVMAIAARDVLYRILMACEPAKKADAP